MKESSLRSWGSLGHYISAAVADNMNITNTLSLSRSMSLSVRLQQVQFKRHIGMISHCLLLCC